MSRTEENSHFTCIVCDKKVVPLENGSFRNHCPFCLSSVHVDIVPGDRKSTCHGTMRAKGLCYNTKKGWQIVHLCEKCGCEKVNKIAQNSIQSDDWDKIIELS